MVDQLYTTNIYTKQGRDFAWADGKGLTIYNLGSGHSRYPNVKGIDLLADRGADIVHNLDSAPWPIADSSVDLLVSFQTFEHLSDLVVAMQEVHRVLKPGGQLVVEVPYFRHPGAFQDPTHKHFFTAVTMEYFCRTAKRGPVYTTFAFTQKGFWYGWPRSNSFLARMAKQLITRHHHAYDRFWSIFFPVPMVVYELEKQG